MHVLSRLACEPIVNEETADSPGTRVKVFVGAPHRKIDIPVVKRHGDVADCVGQIPSADTALRMMSVFLAR